jgi:hypothetical protein
MNCDKIFERWCCTYKLWGSMEDHTMKIEIHVCYHVGYHNHYHPWSHLQISCNIGSKFSLHKHGKKVVIIIPRGCALKVHPKQPMWKCTTIRYCWSLKLPPIFKMIMFKFIHFDTIVHWKPFAKQTIGHDSTYGKLVLKNKTSMFKFH